MQVRGGIIIPFISERHAAAISLEKPQLCVYGLAAGTSTANVVLQKIGFSVLTTGFEMRAAGAKICISGVGKEIWNSRKYSLAERKVISMTVCAQNFPRPCRADDRSSAFFNLKIDFPGTPPPPPSIPGTLGFDDHRILSFCICYVPGIHTNFVNTFFPNGRNFFSR